MNIIRMVSGVAFAIGLSACSTVESDPQVVIETKVLREGEVIMAPSVVMRAEDEAVIEVGDGNRRTSDLKASFETKVVDGEHFLGGYVQHGKLKRLTGPGRFAKGVFKKIPIDGEVHEVPMGTAGRVEILPTLVDQAGLPVDR